MNRFQIGVIGPSKNNLPEDSDLAQGMLEQAERVGELLAEAGVVLFTGGQDGVMEAAARGAKLKGGITVGIPGRQRRQCNSYIDVEVCTPIDVGDYLFAGNLSCDAMIVFPGGAGTIAELALAYRQSIPMVIARGYHDFWDRLIGNALDRSKKLLFEGASTAEECVQKVLGLASRRSH